MLRAPISPPFVMCGLLTVGLLTSAPAMAQGPVWSEEFDSGSQPNEDVWTYDIGSGPNNDGWGNWELQDYTNNPQNVKIEDGKLIITAIPNIVGEEVVGFTSARIKTQDKLMFKYGRIEARIKVPDLERGLWPAFWLLGSNFAEVGWPASGELDILEMGMLSAIQAGEGKVNEWVASAAHWESGGNYAYYSRTLESGINLTDEFHVLTMDWTPSTITTYIDGEEIWPFDIGNSNCNCDEFQKPHFMILNMAVGGTFTGMRSIGAITATLPATMEVDWVRIYDNGYTELYGSSLGAPDIGPAHSGSWYNPDQTGHGFSMEFTETDELGRIAVVYWYTYDDQGNPIFMVGNGVPNGTRVELNFFAYKGMVYGEFDPDTNNDYDGGTAVIDFSDRENAVFSYTPSQDMIDYFGHTTGVENLPLVKLLGIPADLNFSSDTLD